jgi:hypothetical protein
VSAPLQVPLSMLDGYGLLDHCQDCGGTGIVADDGSVTDMIGWPLPCACTDAVPPHLRTNHTGHAPRRSAVLDGYTADVLAAPLFGGDR